MYTKYSNSLKYDWLKNNVKKSSLIDEVKIHEVISSVTLSNMQFKNVFNRFKSDGSHDQFKKLLIQSNLESAAQLPLAEVKVFKDTYKLIVEYVFLGLNTRKYKVKDLSKYMKENKDILMDNEAKLIEFILQLLEDRFTKQYIDLLQDPCFGMYFKNIRTNIVTKTYSMYMDNKIPLVAKYFIQQLLVSFGTEIKNKSVLADMFEEHGIRTTLMLLLDLRQVHPSVLKGSLKKVFKECDIKYVPLFATVLNEMNILTRSVAEFAFMSSIEEDEYEKVSLLLSLLNHLDLNIRKTLRELDLAGYKDHTENLKYVSSGQIRVYLFELINETDIFADIKG